nr:MAG: capsid protein [Cressdnaviricota sp.]
MYAARKGRRTFTKKRMFVRKSRKSYVANPLSGRLNLDTTRVKCEIDVPIYLPLSSQDYQFAGPIYYANLTTLLSSSFTWSNMNSLYGRFKILGLNLLCSRVISDGLITTNVNTEGLAPLYVALYPQLTSSNLGPNPPTACDSAAKFDVYSTRIQSKYWKFPDNFFESNGLGLGTWNPTNAVSNLTGELALGSVSGNGNCINATITVFSLKVTFYVAFSSKNQ